MSVTTAADGFKELTPPLSDADVEQPVKLGRAGVEQIIEIKLTADEQAAFDKSAAAVRELVDKLKL
jgi:malate dehydrogenase